MISNMYNKMMLNSMVDGSLSAINNMILG